MEDNFDFVIQTREDIVTLKVQMAEFEKDMIELKDDTKALKADLQRFGDAIINRLDNHNAAVQEKLEVIREKSESNKNEITKMSSGTKKSAGGFGALTGFVVSVIIGIIQYFSSGS